VVAAAVVVGAAVLVVVVVVSAALGLLLPQAGNSTTALMIARKIRVVRMPVKVWPRGTGSERARRDLDDSRPQK
jgi:hypothetical protein